MHRHQTIITAAAAAAATIASILTSKFSRVTPGSRSRVLLTPNQQRQSTEGTIITANDGFDSSKSEQLFQPYIIQVLL